MKAALLTALAATALALSLPTESPASSYVRFGVQDDSFLAGTKSLENRLELLDRLGVKLVRYTVDWRQVATRKPRRALNPGDPAYDWSHTDSVLRGLHRHRIAVLVTLYGAPAWANGGAGPNVVPRSKYALAAFAGAVARRYPWIRLWEIWNEPNLRRFLKPNSPQLYVRRLLNPTTALLHRLRWSNQVAGGATSPRRSPSGMSPVEFMRGMRSAHARFDAYSHHPYPVTRGERPFGFALGTCRYCRGILTLANLPALLREVRRDFGSKRIWLTEYGYQTRLAERFSVSRRTQAAYVSQAALRAKNAPRVDVLIHFLVRDDPSASGWQSGFLTAAGKRKPSFQAYMLPLAQVTRKHLRTKIWGQVRPGKGRRVYRLQRYAHGRWVWVGGYRQTSVSGSYTRVVRVGRGARLRIVVPALDAAGPALTIR
jgi:polysaccharide biosynthesis protein PslG